MRTMAGPIARGRATRLPPSARRRASPRGEPLGAGRAQIEVERGASRDVARQPVELRVDLEDDATRLGIAVLEVVDQLSQLRQCLFACLGVDGVGVEL